MKLHLVHKRMKGALAWCGRRNVPLEQQTPRADQATCAACWQNIGRFYADTQYWVWHDRGFKPPPEDAGFDRCIEKLSKPPGTGH